MGQMGHCSPTDCSNLTDFLRLWGIAKDRLQNGPKKEKKQKKERERRVASLLTTGRRKAQRSPSLSFLHFLKTEDDQKLGIWWCTHGFGVIVKIHFIWIHFGDVLVTLLRWTCKGQGFLPVRPHLGEEPEEDLKKAPTSETLAQQQPTYAQQPV